MPLYKCRKCPHEWESQDRKPCDWCGTDTPEILEKKTALRRCVEDWLQRLTTDN